MTTKREWVRNLKALKKNPRTLSPAECDELIVLLGSTARPNHRPPKNIFGGYNVRRLNWTTIAGIVFGYLENNERIEQLKAECQLLTDHDEIADIERRIEILKPLSAKTRAEAVRMTSKRMLAQYRVNKTPKQINNELSALRQEAGLKQLGLTEWRELRSKRNNLQLLNSAISEV